MPAPLLLARPSGLYVRFLVPADLRRVVGSRFLVRPLHAPPGDGARLVAALMAVALSSAFKALRQGTEVDLKKALEAAKAAGRRDLTLENITLPNGATLSGVKIDNEQDRLMFSQALEDIGKIEMPAFAPVLAPAVSAREVPALSLAIDLHTSDLARAGRNSKTVIESRHALKLFLGVVGDRPVSELTQDHVRAFFEAVKLWPSNATRREPYKGKTVRQVLALSKANQEPPPAAATLSKARQRLAVFLNAQTAAGVLAVSPLRGLPAPSGVDAEATGRAFTPAELRAIFEPARFEAWASKYPHRWWGVAIGLFSGARVNEVAQLFVDDIETVDGVPGFHINNRHPKQKLKNKASRRFVPLAQPVLAAGFLTFVDEVRAAGHARLFPHLPCPGDLGYGRQLSKQFRAYLLAVGVTDEGMGFHAFRHSFITALDRAGVSERQISRLTGHTVAGSILSKHYIDPPTLAERVDVLAKFVPDVVLPTYTPGQFAPALKVAPKEVAAPKRKPKK